MFLSPVASGTFLPQRTLLSTTVSPLSFRLFFFVIQIFTFPQDVPADAAFTLRSSSLPALPCIPIGCVPTHFLVQPAWLLPFGASEIPPRRPQIPSMWLNPLDASRLQLPEGSEALNTGAAEGLHSCSISSLLPSRTPATPPALTGPHGSLGFWSGPSSPLSRS